MFFSSLMPSQRVMQTPPVIGITAESSLDNYIKVFSRAKYLRYYLNSVVTSSGTVIVVMFIALLASYSFSRYTFRGKNTVLTMILSVQMFPILAILISRHCRWPSCCFVPSLIPCPVRWMKAPGSMAPEDSASCSPFWFR